MEEMTITGSFQEFRSAMIEEREEARKDWHDSLSKIDLLPDGDEKRALMREQLKLYDKYSEAAQAVHDFECDHVMSRLRDALIKLIAERLNENRKYAQQKLSDIFSSYEEARKNEVPFREREQLLENKNIEMYTQVAESPEVRPSDIVLRPAQDWLPEGNGYDRLKELGVRKFVAQNLMFMYEIKNET